ncbi:MAG: 2'-5' RNA ligase family protein [Lachnospiraceae bacterium]|nr:2'-5' RNA ligase family protein [Lachnospiraceae bacterium]
MYLISIYFDDKTNDRIQQFIHQVAKKSGNTFMLDGNVPPHITISAFESRQEAKVIQILEQVAAELKTGTIQWAAVGMFLPYVIYLAPVLNEYLHTLSQNIFDSLSVVEDIKIRPCYQPFSWIPHTTIGKKLSKEEMKIAFDVLQNQFGTFQGMVTKIGLAKTNPYEELCVVSCKH